MKTIVLTGGGTAGHVTPNIALIPALKTAGYDIHYIGSYEGMEKALIEDFSIPYHGISSGKLRRYFSLKNITDPFRVIKGFFEAKAIIKELKPSIVFSKGGFVTVPVVWAAKKNHVPVIVHESDMTPGLANRLSFSSATKICCNFPETVDLLPKEKAVLTGLPIRAELMLGDAGKAEEICGFEHPEKPVIMVVGGSLGAASVNAIIRKILPRLTEKFNVLHLCGKGKLDESLVGTEGYRQIEYAKEEMKDLFALSEIVVSRAGANAICELLALHKPNLLIPLPTSASRGDQLLNAESFRKQGFSLVLDEDKDLTEDSLYENICDLYDRREEFRKVMLKSDQTNAVSLVVKLIEENSLENSVD